MQCGLCSLCSGWHLEKYFNGSLWPVSSPPLPLQSLHWTLLSKTAQTPSHTCILISSLSDIFVTLDSTENSWQSQCFLYVGCEVASSSVTSVGFLEPQTEPVCCWQASYASILFVCWLTIAFSSGTSMPACSLCAGWPLLLLLDSLCQCDLDVKLTSASSSGTSVWSIFVWCWPLLNSSSYAYMVLHSDVDLCSILEPSMPVWSLCNDDFCFFYGTSKLVCSLCQLLALFAQFYYTAFGSRSTELWTSL